MDTTQILSRFCLTLVVILSFIVIGSLLKNKELFDRWIDYGMFLAHPTRSFSAEADVPPEYRLFQQPTKCFSCERELRNMYGLNPNMTYMANPTKCFSCERQFLAQQKPVEPFTNLEDAFRGATAYNTALDIENQEEAVEEAEEMNAANDFHRE